MNGQMERIARETAYTLTNSETTTPAVDMSGCAFGEIHFPASYGSTTVTAYSYSTLHGWLPYATTLTIVTPGVVQFPTEWAAAKVLRLKTNADSSDKSVAVILKS